MLRRCCVVSRGKSPKRYCIKEGSESELLPASFLNCSPVREYRSFQNNTKRSTVEEYNISMFALQANTARVVPHASSCLLSSESNTLPTSERGLFPTPPRRSVFSVPSSRSTTANCFLFPSKSAWERCVTSPIGLSKGIDASGGQSHPRIQQRRYS